MIQLPDSTFLLSDFKMNLLHLKAPQNPMKNVFEVQGALDIGQQVNCIAAQALDKEIPLSLDRARPADKFLSQSYSSN
jgi:hypothetical protein